MKTGTASQNSIGEPDLEWSSQDTQCAADGHKLARYAMLRFGKGPHLVTAVLSIDKPTSITGAKFFRDALEMAHGYGVAFAAKQNGVTTAPSISQAAQDVLAERQRQIDAEGHAVHADDAYQASELALASAGYAMLAAAADESLVERVWPWPKEYIKKSNARRMLVKSAALALAEIERYDRMNDTNKDAQVRTKSTFADASIIRVDHRT